MEKLIEFQQVTKQYEGHVALREVAFTLPKGSIFGLLGPNGAGKTTLLRILTRILLPDTGRVVFDGEELTDNHVRKIGYLPEERGLYPKMKADEHLAFLAALKGLSSKQIKESTSFWVKKLEIEGLMERKIDALSKGQQQKIQLMAALLHDPDFIILDEPFSGFDPVNAELLKDILLDLKAQGKTLLISTHRMENAEELCDEVVMLHKGRVVLEGSLDSVLSQQGGRSFQVITESPLSANADFEVVKVEKNQSWIRTKEVMERNALLQSLMQQTQVISFLPQKRMLKEVFLENARQED
jgi:ABC-2 type transport system ATP-binding protein